MGHADIAMHRHRASVTLISLPIVVLLAGCMLLAGCALPWQQQSAAKLRAQPVMRLALLGIGSPDLSYLDPAREAPIGPGSSDSQVVGLIFDQLVTLDTQSRPELWGALSVTTSPDGLTYTFTLRPGQRFSDGTPVHASDYAYAMDRLLNPCLQAPGNFLLWMLKDAQTFSTEYCSLDSPGVITRSPGQTGPLITTLVGDAIVPNDGAGTLTLRLARPTAYFLASLAAGGSFAIERSVVTGANLGQDGKWTANLLQGATGQGGSGMFYVSAWDPMNPATGPLVLKANPQWWGRAQGKTPWLRELDIHVLASNELTAVTPGAPFDYAGEGYVSTTGPSGAPPADLVSHTLPTLATRTVMLNWQVPPFDSLDARRAFCLAINRDALDRELYGGRLIPGWNLVPHGIPGYSPSTQGIDGDMATAGDPARARAYWAAYVTSLHGKPVPALSVFYWSSASYDLYQELARQWRSALAGANVQVRVQGDQLMTPYAEKHVQMYTGGWIGDYPDPQDFLSLYSTTSSYNFQNASVPLADHVTAAADALFAPDQQARRDALYAQAEQLLVQQVAACPLGQLTTTYLLSPKVRHFGQSAMGIVPLDDFVAATVTR